MKIGNISLGKNSRKYTHDLSHDVNTTLGFGNVQPSLCQLMNIGDSININAKQLVRLAPLPVPTFGRMSVINRAVFVPAREVFPFYDAMLSNQTVTTSSVQNGFIPNKLPVTSSLQLCTMLMEKKLGRIGFWQNEVGASSGKMQRSDSDSLYDDFHERLSSGGHAIALPAVNSESFIEYLPEDASLSSCDYLVALDSANGIAKKLLGIRLTDKGRRVHSILRSLGYSMTFSDGQYVSALPIFAFYKAWFDCYHPKLDINFQDTQCWKSIVFCREYPMTVSNIDEFNSKRLPKLIIDLAECFYSSDLDFVSAHKARMLYDKNDNVSYIDPDGYSDKFNRDNDNNYPEILSSGLSRLSYDALTKLTRYATKDTLIGSKLYDWIRVHYGETTANSLFDQSTNLGSWTVNADVSDVISTSETYNSEDNNGDVLGAYAGKGIGFNNGHISFKANDFGFLIILTCVVPKSGYSQGTDPALLGIDTWTLPNPDFDAIGYEATPVNCIYDDGGLTLLDNTFDSELHDKGFGFIPRYSGYKIKKNVISGDFSRLPSRHLFDPYHLDRIVSTSVSDIGNDTFLAMRYRPPYASTAWRYPTKYAWLGNFNRIFYNSGNAFNKDSLSLGVVSPSDAPIDDNFIIQTVFDIKYKSLLKPIRESYDVFDEHTNSGETDTSVSGE